MGTRADFYVGKGKEAEWLGSIAWDGYRDGIPGELLDCRSERDYRNEVAKFLATREDATLPEQGWPWPWNDSRTTDCSYWFFDAQCWDEMGQRFFSCLEDMPDEPDMEKYERVEFPDMSARKNVTFGDRSGLSFFGIRE